MRSWNRLAFETSFTVSLSSSGTTRSGPTCPSASTPGAIPRMLTMESSLVSFLFLFSHMIDRRSRSRAINECIIRRKIYMIFGYDLYFCSAINSVTMPGQKTNRKATK